MNFYDFEIILKFHRSEEWNALCIWQKIAFYKSKPCVMLLLSAPNYWTIALHIAHSQTSVLTHWYRQTHSHTIHTHNFFVKYHNPRSMYGSKIFRVCVSTKRRKQITIVLHFRKGNFLHCVCRWNDSIGKFHFNECFNYRKYIW